MTARQVFEATLIELSKVQAPSLKLYEFNYLFNKAINQYINKIYNVYDVNQQTTDDLRVLKSTAYLTPTKFGTNSALMNTTLGDNSVTSTIPGDASGSITEYYESNGVYFQKNTVKTTINNKVTTTITNKKYTGTKKTLSEAKADLENWVVLQATNASSYLSQAHKSIQSLHGATYEVELPLDYLHMLNCVCIYYVAKTKDCWDAGSYIEVPATRLTADSWSQIVTDIYNRPSPMKPYYYIHNINVSNDLPTSNVTDFSGNYNVTAYNQNEGSNFNRNFKLNGTDASVVEKPIASRIGNASKVRCEIRYGKDDTLFQLAEVHVDYVKVPQHIRLTQEQIDLTEDTSQIMEFPDYVNQEIINELVHLVMERTSDPRIGTHAQIAQSIARPTGQQTQQA